jgi:hypothetical protein
MLSNLSKNSFAALVLVGVIFFSLLFFVPPVYGQVAYDPVIIEETPAPGMWSYNPVVIGETSTSAQTPPMWEYAPIRTVGQATTFGEYAPIQTVGQATTFGSYDAIRTVGSNSAFNNYDPIKQVGQNAQFGNYEPIRSVGNNSQFGSYDSIRNVGQSTRFSKYDPIKNVGQTTSFGAYDPIKTVGQPTTFSNYDPIKNVGQVTQFGNYAPIRTVVQNISDQSYRPIVTPVMENNSYRYSPVSTIDTGNTGFSYAQPVNIPIASISPVNQLVTPAATVTPSSTQTESSTTETTTSSSSSNENTTSEGTSTSSTDTPVDTTVVPVDSSTVDATLDTNEGTTVDHTIPTKKPLLDEATTTELIDAVADKSTNNIQYRIMQGDTDVSKHFKVSFTVGSVIANVIPTDEAAPGAYTFQFAFANPINGEVHNFTQNFLLGVVALNTDKDIYNAGETATIDIGIIDNAGVPECFPAGSQYPILTIIDSNNVSTPVTVTNTGQCEIMDSTNVAPDYVANFTFPSDGVYTLQVVADTGTGPITMSREVKVDGNAPFTVERVAATRLYPVGWSPMTAHITAHAPFTGTITESLPNGFDIQNITVSVVGTGTVGNATFIDDAQGRRIVIDTVALQTGDILNFSYEYDSPDISPEFYIIGPMLFTGTDASEYLEARNWQIANDNPVEVPDADLIGW